MYNGSKEHLDNLTKARAVAATKYGICPFCSKELRTSALKHHLKTCESYKVCQVCKAKFKTKSTTCSVSCANTFFRSGSNHPNWKSDSYRKICFANHVKECIICKENKIVEVHHLNGIKADNSPANLIPLCPTHHKYWHSKYKILIESEVSEYVKKWVLSNTTLQV